MSLVFDSPEVFIDLDVVDRNIDRMQSRAEELGLKLRPHVKTHKLPLLAHRQLEAGAVGVACQKLSEAWVMASSGVGPILITYPLIGELKLKRAARLAAEFEISFCADSATGVEGLADHLDSRSVTTVIVDCDTAKWRTGVPEPLDALVLAKLIQSKPNLKFGGLITHPAPDEARNFFVEAQGLFRETGLPIPAISVGGTSRSFEDIPAFEVATELRTGTYIYGDRACINAGSHTEDQCAMRVHATVISLPSVGRAVIDAGSKVLAADFAEGVGDELYGSVVGQPGMRIPMLSEEHGHLDTTDLQHQLELGQTVEIIPNHACAVTNLTDSVLLHRSGDLVGIERVSARGKSR